MTTTSEKPETSAKIRWGAHFKATREAMHLTEKDAASRLHLNPAMIALIESESFRSEKDTTPAIFMRGYVRSYARLLNISDKHINQALIDLGLADLTTSKVSSPALLARKIDTRSNNQFTSWSTTIVVLVLVGLVGMWWNTHNRNNAAELASQNSAQGNNLANSLPVDPTPKELVNPATPTTQAENDAPAPTPPPEPTSVVQNGQTPSNLPTSEQKPAPLNEEQTVVNNTVTPSSKPYTPGETQDGSVAANVNPTTAPTATPEMQAEVAHPAPLTNPDGTVTDPNATQLTEQNPIDGSKPPVLAKKHTIKHHRPVEDTPSDEMAMPEPGLMEPGADPDPNETN